MIQLKIVPSVLQTYWRGAGNEKTPLSTKHEVSSSLFITILRKPQYIYFLNVSTVL